MLVAEGTARRLAPDANMWLLIRPIIEEWVITNLGPEAKVRDAIQNLQETLERLPDMVASVERGSQMLAEGNIKLHPDTIRALRGEDGTSNRTPQVFWLIAFAIFIGFIVVVLD
jgi:ubiquinone biosynthesis protein